MPVGTPPRWYNRWYHYVWLAIASVVLVNWLFADWFVRHRGEVFGYETYRIPSTSMQPTLRLGDFVTVDARSGERTALRRGEIVTYVPAEHPEQMWIARIIGLPGETIVTRDNRAAIDGNVLDEPYIQIEGNPIPVEAIPFPSAKLGSDEVYLMGDNRLNAADSRFQGPVPVSALRGKVKAIWFSYSPITHTIETARIGSLSAAHAR
nr:signal peptidase I [Lysobacter sp. CFH 32150]